MHDREILQRCDDSVIALVDGAPQLIRRARGLCPLGIELAFEVPPLLAVGGHLKSVFTLARGRFAYQSQHLGDLENMTGLDFFQESLAHLMRTFEIEPEVVVRDLHPGYLSSSWANDWALPEGSPLVAVQHHHAHSCRMHGGTRTEGPVIGLSLDGTGYGTDGKIWGGEVLICRLAGPDPRALTDLPISNTSPCQAAKLLSASHGGWLSATCMRQESIWAIQLSPNFSEPRQKNSR